MDVRKHARVCLPRRYTCTRHSTHMFRHAGREVFMYVVWRHLQKDKSTLHCLQPQILQLAKDFVNFCTTCPVAAPWRTETY